MGRFAVITLTDQAALRVREIMENHDDVKGVIVGVTKGGCAGMEYTVELAKDMPQGMDMVEKDGARVFVAPQAVLFLLGTEMDYETTKLRAGFVFRNPNQTSACGCGESVEIKPVSSEKIEEAYKNA